MKKKSENTGKLLTILKLHRRKFQISEDSTDDYVENDMDKLQKQFEKIINDKEEMGIDGETRLTKMLNEDYDQT